MSILFELRYPTHWYSKLLVIILALAFFTLLATAGIATVLIYRIIKPQRTSTDINMASFPGRPDALTFTVPGMGERTGWFFPGLRGAPTIVLCHGYQSSRGELLTLESTLQDHQYNVFIFDFTGHGAVDGITTFGYREAGELRAAMNALAQRNDVDPARFGVWGYNLGAYAAMSDAETDPRIRAFVADSVYDDPPQMVGMQVQQTGLGGFPFMVRWAQFGFRWLNQGYRHVPPLSKNAFRLAGTPKLFISAVDDAKLAELTRQLFLKSGDPREQVILPHGNFAGMGEEDKRLYENRIVTFFLQAMPPTQPSAR